MLSHSDFVVDSFSTTPRTPSLSAAISCSWPMLSVSTMVRGSLETAHDSYGAWREGQHDDLVLALALALWAGVNTRPAGRSAVAGPRTSFTHVRWL